MSRIRRVVCVAFGMGLAVAGVTAAQAGTASAGAAAQPPAVSSSAPVAQAATFVGRGSGPTKVDALLDAQEDARAQASAAGFVNCRGIGSTVIGTPAGGYTATYALSCQ
jgi:hypothetical protein